VQVIFRGGGGGGIWAMCWWLLCKEEEEVATKQSCHLLEVAFMELFSHFGWKSRLRIDD
jgi:hypothetical protein